VLQSIDDAAPIVAQAELVGAAKNARWPLVACNNIALLVVNGNQYRLGSAYKGTVTLGGERAWATAQTELNLPIPP
jgi:hypothetical protein